MVFRVSARPRLISGYCLLICVLFKQSDPGYKCSPYCNRELSKSQLARIWRVFNLSQYIVYITAHHPDFVSGTFLLPQDLPQLIVLRAQPAVLMNRFIINLRAAGPAGAGSANSGGGGVSAPVFGCQTLSADRMLANIGEPLGGRDGGLEDDEVGGGE